ncbi:NAD(P)/FAD-dependent oxidoreductase [Yoonia litorea]|uniref:Sarcosine oxidase n=1 Tax=Yoonia litorea TaxID=1123755 RepID=A0A1I6MV16_9RHOB|nr:FAD-dependent oxidoreductase [Yoonia litorea]SFS19471.1 sarcosine oxidase [Yoonia litorea]
MTTYDVIVVGAGLMGSAAARHLAVMGAKVALIGPAEPADKASHQGVFASHYDAARITRQIDTRRNWSRFSQAAIQRYSEIENLGGERFFRPTGAIIAGPEHGAGSDFIRNAQANADKDGVAYEPLRADVLAARFPEFAFPKGILALYEAENAGWIDPRAHITAEIAAAEALGVSLIRAEVRQLKDEGGMVTAICADGVHVTAGKAVVACGPFSKAVGLLPEPLPMKVYARTIAFFELDEAEAARLFRMPSVVYVPPGGGTDPYILPPVRYPDGKTYIKIGGDPIDRELVTVNDMKAWFQSSGDPTAGRFIAETLLGLMPDLAYKSISYGSCATSFSPHGNPFIYHQTNRIMALTAGNGAGAKCADELGRLGALVAMGEDIPIHYDGKFD